MHKKWQGGERLLWLLFFLAFSGCLVAALLSSVQVYQKVADRLEGQFGLHTGLHYLESRIHTYDQQGRVAVGEVAGSSALLCWESDGEDTYVTAIYCMDGKLRELYTRRDALLAPEAGECLLDLDQVTFSQEGPLLTVTCTDGKAEGSLQIYLRSGEGER